VETATAAGERMLAAYANYPTLTASEAETRLREIASNAATPRLVAELRGDLGRLAAGYPGGRTRLWVGPLATRETAVDEHRRTVEVWFSRVVAPPGREVYVEWRLGRLDLVWERDGWRLDGFDERAGPRPAALPGRADPPAEILSALDGFASEPI
jgi:hypothetical protein